MEGEDPVDEMFKGDKNLKQMMEELQDLSGQKKKKTYGPIEWCSGCLVLIIMSFVIGILVAAGTLSYRFIMSFFE